MEEKKNTSGKKRWKRKTTVDKDENGEQKRKEKGKVRRTPKEKKKVIKKRVSSWKGK